MKVLTTLKTTSLAVAALLAASAASATPITTWTYAIENGLHNWTPTGAQAAFYPTGYLPNAALGAGYFGEVRWGDDAADGNQGVIGDIADQSALTIDRSLAGNYLTNSGWQDGAVFTHENNVIYTPNTPWLKTTDLLTTIQLTGILPSPPGPGAPIPLGIDFNIQFIETVNQAPCFVGSVTVCDDVMLVLNPISSLTVPFNYLGEDYTVTLEVNGLGPLSNAACAAAGGDPGCVGFQTRENADNTFQARFRIDYVKTPEPATLALVGLGLLGFGFQRFRKAS